MTGWAATEGTPQNDGAHPDKGRHPRKVGVMRPEDFGIPMWKTCTCVNKRCRHHQELRAMWKPYVEAGVVTCWRCGELIPSDAEWDLGHDDDDITRYRGPETWACNRSTSLRRKQPERRWVL